MTDPHRPPATRPPALRLVPVRTPDAPTQPPLPLPEVPGLVAPDPEIPPRVARTIQAIAVGLVEALAGRRPLSQLHTVLADPLVLQAEHLVRTRAAAGLRPASVRMQLPHDHAAEVAIRLSDGRRSCAAALRLERVQGHWRCVRLELGPAGSQQGLRPPLRGSA